MKQVETGRLPLKGLVPFCDPCKGRSDLRTHGVDGQRKWPIKNLRGWSAQRGATGPCSSPGRPVNRTHICRRLQQFLEVTDLDNLFIIKGVVFSPDSKGTYYIAVGSEGEDRTGTYTINMTGKRIE